MKSLTVLNVSLFGFSFSYGQVGINAATIDASAAFDVHLVFSIAPQVHFTACAVVSNNSYGNPELNILQKLLWYLLPITSPPKHPY